MTQEEYKIFKSLPKRLKDLISIGELEVDLYEFEKRLKEKGVFTDEKVREHQNSALIDMKNRKHDMIRTFLDLKTSTGTIQKKTWRSSK